MMSISLAILLAKLFCPKFISSTMSIYLVAFNITTGLISGRCSFHACESENRHMHRVYSGRIKDELAS